MPKPPAYGIIYNWDGAPHGFVEVPQSLEAFLDKVYAPMEGTQVGAHFWCVGEHAAKWKSDDLEVIGDLHGRRYESTFSYYLTENLLEMLERGLARNGRRGSGGARHGWIDEESVKRLRPNQSGATSKIWKL